MGKVNIDLGGLFDALAGTMTPDKNPFYNATTDDSGNVYDKDSNVIGGNDENGPMKDLPTTTDANGNIVDQNGKPVDTNNLYKPITGLAALTPHGQEMSKWVNQQNQAYDPSLINSMTQTQASAVNATRTSTALAEQNASNAVAGRVLDGIPKNQLGPFGDNTKEQNISLGVGSTIRTPMQINAQRTALSDNSAGVPETQSSVNAKLTNAQNILAAGRESAAPNVAGTDINKSLYDYNNSQAALDNQSTDLQTLSKQSQQALVAVNNHGLLQNQQNQIEKDKLDTQQAIVGAEKGASGATARGILAKADIDASTSENYLKTLPFKNVSDFNKSANEAFESQVQPQSVYTVGNRINANGSVTPNSTNPAGISPMAAKLNGMDNVGKPTPVNIKTADGKLIPYPKPSFDAISGNLVGSGIPQTSSTTNAPAAEKPMINFSESPINSDLASILKSQSESYIKNSNEKEVSSDKIVHGTDDSLVLKTSKGEQYKILTGKTSSGTQYHYYIDKTGKPVVLKVNPKGLQ